MSNGERTLGEAFRLIEDTREACARRAAKHVDKELYISEKEHLQRELKTVRDQCRDLSRQVALQDKQRRQLWLAVFTAFIAPIATGLFLWTLLGGATP